MRLKLDLSKPVLNERGKPIFVDQFALAQDMARLRTALTTIEQGADDPEEVAHKALAAIEEEPMVLRDLIETTLHARKVKFVDDGKGGRMPVPDEPEMSAGNKLLAGRLGIKIHARDTIELSTKEVRFLERRSGACNSPHGHVSLMVALHPERQWDDEEEDDEDEDELDDSAAEPARPPDTV